MASSFSISASRTCEHMARNNRRTTPKPARFTPKSDEQMKAKKSDEKNESKKE